MLIECQMSNRSFLGEMIDLRCVDMAKVNTDSKKKYFFPLFSPICNCLALKATVGLGRMETLASTRRLRLSFSDPTTQAPANQQKSVVQTQECDPPLASHPQTLLTEIVRMQTKASGTTFWHSTPGFCEGEWELCPCLQEKSLPNKEAFSPLPAESIKKRSSMHFGNVG